MVAQYPELDGLYFIEYILTENYFRRKMFHKFFLELVNNLSSCKVRWRYSWRNTRSIDVIR